MRAKARLDRSLEGLLAALMALAVVNVSWQVFARYVLGQPSSFTDELSRFALIWIGLFGAAHGVGRRLHLSMNLVLLRLTGARRDALAVAIDVAVGAFALFVMVIGGGRLVWLSFELGQRSAALGVPLGIVYLALPVSGLLIVFYSAVFTMARRRQMRAGGREACA